MSKIRDTSRFPPCVILGGGAGPAVLEFGRALGTRGMPVYVGLVDESSPRRYAYSRYCRDVWTIPPAQDSETFCRQLLEWRRAQPFPTRPYLFPLIDTTCTYVAEGRSLLQDGFHVCLPDERVVLDMLHKAKATELAEANGLDVAQYGVADSPEELARLADTMTYPVIVKPTWWRGIGGIKFKTVRCHTRESLLRCGSELIASGATIFVQWLIPGGAETLEVFIFYRSQDGRTIHRCTGRKIRILPPGADVTVSAEAAWLPDVAAVSETFLRRIDYRGLGGIEYKRHDGKLYFIEMSVRPEAFHALGVQAGIDLSWYACADYVLGEMPREHEVQREAYWLNGSYYLFVWRAERGTLKLLSEIARLFATGKAAWAIWCRRDPLPWFADVAEMAAAVLRKILRRLLPGRRR